MNRSGAHVLLAVPTRGQIRWETVTALEAARDYTPGLGPILWQPGNLSVALTRNRIVKRFLEGDWPVLAMVDDDIAPPINFIELLDPCLDTVDVVALAHPMTHPNSPGTLIAGAFARVLGGYSAVDLHPGVNPCDAVATGCVLIRREVIEKLGPTAFRMENDPDAVVQSDDFLFCHDAASAGFKIGAYWEAGHFPDHFATVNLEPLLRERLGFVERSIA